MAVSLSRLPPFEWHTFEVDSIKKGPLHITTISELVISNMASPVTVLEPSGWLKTLFIVSVRKQSAIYLHYRWEESIII